MSQPARKGETTVRLAPLAVATAAELRDQLAPACHRIEVAGAVRRRDSEMPCIDLVAIPKIEPGEDGKPGHNYLWAVLDYFLADGGYSRRGDLIRSFRRPLKGGAGEIPVNIYTTTHDSWGYELAYRTGPGGFWFNVHTKLNLAGYATRDGKVWSIKTGQPVEVRDESTLFNQLAGMLVREPWQRGGPVEGDRAW